MAREQVGGSWPNRRVAIATATDELLATTNLSGEMFDRLAEHLNSEEILEFCFLVGSYQMLAMTLNALRVQLETEPLVERGGARGRLMKRVRRAMRLA